MQAFRYISGHLVGTTAKESDLNEQIESTGRFNTVLVVLGGWDATTMLGVAVQATRCLVEKVPYHSIVMLFRDLTGTHQPCPYLDVFGKQEKLHGQGVTSEMDLRPEYIAHTVLSCIEKQQLPVRQHNGSFLSRFLGDHFIANAVRQHAPSLHPGAGQG